jgi:acetolactate synthase-1/2/3 large subunit
MEIEQQALSNPTGVETIEASGSVALLEALIAEGTEVIFGYPGGAIMPIMPDKDLPELLEKLV